MQAFVVASTAYLILKLTKKSKKMKQINEVCRYLGVICVVFISGCAVIDPGNVGTGYYFQRLNASGSVIIENDSAKNGYLNCSRSANELVRSNPSMKGQVLCSQQPTTQLLPFNIKIHSENSPGKNESFVTSPFTTRFATRQMCELEMANRKKDAKWVIIESNCATPPAATNSPTKSSIAVEPSKVATAVNRYMQIALYGDILIQLDLAAAQQCEGELEATKKILVNTIKDNYQFACTATDAKLRFRATLKDELTDNPYVVTSKTKPLCLVMATQITKVNIPEINKPRFSITAQCN